MTLPRLRPDIDDLPAYKAGQRPVERDDIVAYKKKVADFKFPNSNTSQRIKKMIKDAGKISYEAKPNPLELHGDSVKVTVTGNFPAKYFHKKATFIVTPVVKYAGGEKELKSITLRGDKVDGGGQNITYTEGGKFTVSDQFLYVKGMEKAEIVLRSTAQYK